MDHNHTEKMREFYTKQAGELHGQDYEFSRWHSSPFQENNFKMTKWAIERALHQVDFTTCFELGPGPGTWTELIFAKNPNVQIDLLDISEYMKQQFEKRFVGKVFQFTLSDFESYVIPDNKYDLVFSSRAIDYMDHQDQVVAKLCNGLKQGGKGILVMKVAHEFKKKLLKQKTDWQHSRIAGYKNIVQYLKQNNCRIDYANPVTVYVPVLGRNAWFNNLVWKCLRSMPFSFINEWAAESYIVTFTKL